MKITDARLGVKLELELINNLSERIGGSYISQLIDIIDSENIIIAAPIHESRLMLISRGTRVQIFFLHNINGLICFRGVIVSRDKTGNVQTFSVRIESELEKIQRRRYYRLECNLEAKYARYSENDRSDGEDTNSQEIPESEYKKTITRNISGSGICIVTNEELGIGTKIQVVVQLGNSIYFKSRCEVLRCALLSNSHKLKKYEVGCHFLSLPKKEQDIIVRYVFEQQRLLLKHNIIDRDI